MRVSLLMIECEPPHFSARCFGFARDAAYTPWYLLGLTISEGWRPDFCRAMYRAKFIEIGLLGKWFVVKEWGKENPEEQKHTEPKE